MTPRFLIIQAVGLVVFATAWAFGIPQYLHAEDATNLTTVIAAAGLMGVLAAAFGKWTIVDHLIVDLPVLGILGTMIGIKIMVGDSDGEYVSLLAGLGTAVNTSIAGLVGMLWLRITRAHSC